MTTLLAQDDHQEKEVFSPAAVGDQHLTSIKCLELKFSHIAPLNIQQFCGHIQRLQNMFLRAKLWPS